MFTFTEKSQIDTEMELLKKRMQELEQKSQKFSQIQQQAAEAIASLNACRESMKVAGISDDSLAQWQEGVMDAIGIQSIGFGDVAKEVPRLQLVPEPALQEIEFETATITVKEETAIAPVIIKELTPIVSIPVEDSGNYSDTEESTQISSILQYKDQKLDFNDISYEEPATVEETKAIIPEVVSDETDDFLDDFSGFESEKVEEIQEETEAIAVQTLAINPNLSDDGREIGLGDFVKTPPPTQVGTVTYLSGDGMCTLKLFNGSGNYHCLNLHIVSQKKIDEPKINEEEELNLPFDPGAVKIFDRVEYIGTLHRELHDEVCTVKTRIGDTVTLKKVGRVKTWNCNVTELKAAKPLPKAS